MDFVTGTASLVEEVDKKLLVILRDGRKLLGILRSFDQFANIVLENCVERIYIENTYGERKVGIFLVRGENVVLLGEINPDKEFEVETKKLQKVDYDTIKKRHDEEHKRKEQEAKQKKRLMLDRGISIDPFTLADNLYFE